MTTDPEAQFHELRPLLFGLAYRTLGSRADAEDIVQEAYLRLQSIPRDTVAAPRPYLTTVVARLSLDLLKSAQRRRETYMGTWLPEPLIAEPPPDKAEMAESLSLAFLHLLQQLSPSERVAFLLHEVFDSSYAEVAQTLGTSEQNSRQLVARARKHLRDQRPRFPVDPRQHAAVLRSFLEACRDMDAARLSALLAPGVVAYNDGGGKVNAALNPIYGADRVLRFLIGVRKKTPLDLLNGYPGVINGSPGFVFTAAGRAVSVMTLELDEDGRIRGIYYVANPEKIRQPTETI